MLKDGRVDWRRLARILRHGPRSGPSSVGSRVLLITAVTWLPAGLALAGLALAAITGCRANEAGATPCLVAGFDIGELLYKLTMMAWFVILLLPFMLITLVLALGVGANALLQAWRRAHPR